MAIGKKVKRVIEAEGIAHVSATFNNTTITPQQKRDILYNNAARFLRLDTAQGK